MYSPAYIWKLLKNSWQRKKNNENKGGNKNICIIVKQGPFWVSDYALEDFKNIKILTSVQKNEEF